MDSGAVLGCLVGTAVGDAIGLPYEALSRRRGARLLGPPDRHRFVFGRGMYSDDTEHTIMVAQALCASGAADADRFRRDLARRLRWWLLGMPAGVGGATLRACAKLWLGFPLAKSGVFSAGNGPAMRSAVVGAALDDLRQVRGIVAASSRLTHTDPKALFGALAVAVAAWSAKRQLPDGAAYLARTRDLLDDPAAGELLRLLAAAVDGAAGGEPTAAFAGRLGCPRGVSGYVYHTVPVAIHAWQRHPASFEAAVRGAVECGGDTDTTAAIVGGIVGSGVGAGGIPAPWVNGLLEWPRGVAWLERLARSLEAQNAAGPARVPPRAGPAVFPRNLLFLAVVLCHVGRRCLPPY